jgi:hypothetical protein
MEVEVYILFRVKDNLLYGKSYPSMAHGGPGGWGSQSF